MSTGFVCFKWLKFLWEHFQYYNTQFMSFSYIFSSSWSLNLSSALLLLINCLNLSNCQQVNCYNKLRMNAALGITRKSLFPTRWNKRYQFKNLTSVALMLSKSILFCLFGFYSILTLFILNLVHSNATYLPLILMSMMYIKKQIYPSVELGLQNLVTLWFYNWTHLKF